MAETLRGFRYGEIPPPRLRILNNARTVIAGHTLGGGNWLMPAERMKKRLAVSHSKRMQPDRQHASIDNFVSRDELSIQQRPVF